MYVVSLPAATEVTSYDFWLMSVIMNLRGRI